MAFQNQSSKDARTQAREEDMNVGYEGNHLSHTFEGLEQKFLDEVLKLAKEQSDAEDSENARHREVSLEFSGLIFFSGILLTVLF